MTAVRRKMHPDGFSIAVTNVAKGRRIFSAPRAKNIVSTVMQGEGIRAAKVSVVFVDDARIRRINSQFLHHRSVTDVITFPLEEAPDLEAEIYVNLQQAKRQAEIFGVSVRNEAVRLIVHGTLHALGYDDRRTKQRKTMFEKQERYVTALCKS
ncbi:MAG: rRNA maturation RNase YbeY [Bacteroidota bacterium]|nr:rRNA maturation RNase YbeY [Bacteroidota bacterium]